MNSILRIRIVVEELIFITVNGGFINRFCIFSHKSYIINHGSEDKIYKNSVDETSNENRQLIGS